MSSITPVSGLSSMPVETLGRMPALLRPGDGLGGSQASGKAEFGDLMGQVVDTVQAQHAEAQRATRAVLTGESDQIHQSMIAMQESSVAFSLMVEVRNRLVESYQELMRMPV